MTTFQIIVTVALAVIALLIALLIRVVWCGVNLLLKNQDVTFETVEHIDSVLKGGFEQTGRERGGFNIRPIRR